MTGLRTQPGRRFSGVAVAATVLIVAQIVVRAWAASRGGFYWDDLILIGRAGDHPILSWDYLGDSHDGHVMPAAYLFAGLSTLIAPTQWWLPAVTLVVLQAIASAAVWRMIRILAPHAQIGALAALAFYLFTPMTLPAYEWWAAGLNSLPMQAATAIVVGNTVLLIRDPERSPASRRRLVAGAVLAFVVGLLFFEKSLFILPIAAVAALLAARGLPDRGRTRGLWWWLGGIFVAWAAVVGVVSDASLHGSLGQTAKLVWKSIADAVVPSTVGGPWNWGRWLPAPPTGDPALWMQLLGWALIIGVVGATVYLRRGTAPIWLAAAVYVVGAQAVVMWIRSSGQTALELGQTMRYLPDAAVVITIALALVAAAGPRGAHEAGPARAAARAPRWAVAAGVAVLVLSSLIGASRFLDSWRESPTPAYIATARDSLREHPDAVMFDQSVPLEVLSPMVYPDNQVSRIFGRLHGRSAFGDQTEKLSVLDDRGALVPGGVSPARTVEASDGACDRPTVDGPAELKLSAPVIDWEWTVGLSYCATKEGQVAVSLGGPERTVTVHRGLHPLYFQLSGTGGVLRIRPVTEGLALHTGEGRVGEPIVAAYAP
ncbi:MAG: hypothetical protein QM774_08510 [Gordonia sp. (in: high G+C Gram-positive bacteria)]|uniref:hypothetical protein n=1 Tax=Gordonia sp. (in: high G+C Gram-positive bacteria) TaxID=84139 RepID=UPI0039E305FF